MAANFDVGTGWVSIVPKMGDFSQIPKQLDKTVVTPSQSWGERMGDRITSGLLSALALVKRSRMGLTVLPQQTGPRKLLRGWVTRAMRLPRLWAM